MANKLKDRLARAFRQESTWRGIIAILAAFGLVIEPELQAQIITFALVLMGAINVAKDD